MEIAAKGENKHLKYNHVVPIDLDTIPKEELETALKEFAEGSFGLEYCLRVMWQHGLKTHACCAGEDSDYQSAYIAMAPGVDAFSFLSDSLLESDFISLECVNQKQIFRFGGARKLREQTFLELAHDIQTGKKNNQVKVEEKIGKGLNAAWLKEARIYDMKNAGFSEEEIAFREKGRELLQKLDTIPKEQEDQIMEEYTEYVRVLMERLLVAKNEERTAKGKK